MNTTSILKRTLGVFDLRSPVTINVVGSTLTDTSKMFGKKKG